MKNYKGILYFSLLIFILLFSISSASALDFDNSENSISALNDYRLNNNENLLVSEKDSDLKDFVSVGDSFDDLNEYGIVGDSLDDLNESESENNDFNLEKAHDHLKSNSQNSNVLSSDANSFTALENLISSSSSGAVNLLWDYSYSSGDNKEGILVDRDIEINGNNHTLDALSMSRIFNLTKDHTLTLNDLNIINANSGFNGGAIFAEGNVIANNCTFKDNTILNASYIHYYSEYDFHNGGAIFINSSSSQSKFLNCRFIDNIGENGGAIYSCTDLTIENCSFLSNTALGGLDYDLSCYGENTYVGGEGASIYCLGDCSIINSEFSGNVADLTEAKGPGVVYLHSNSFIQNSNFTNNNADAVVYWLADGMIEGSLFLNNSAHDCGGAIFLAGNATVNDCDFINNSGSNYGGAIYSVGYYDYNIYTDNHTFYDSSISIDNCNFINNYAYFDGGALYLIANTTVTNCNFTGNYLNVEKFKEVNPYYYYWDLSTAGKGGAVYIENGTLSSSRFMNNNATLYGGAIYSNGSASVQNSVFADNVASSGNDIYNVKNLSLSGNEMDSESATIFNDNFFHDGFIQSPITLTVLDNKTYYLKSITKFNVFASLSDDMGNLIEDYKIQLDIDSFNQDTLFNNQTGFYEYELTNIFEPGTLLIGGSYTGSSDLIVKTSLLNIGVIPTELALSIGDVDFGQDVIANISLSGLDGLLLNETVDLIIINAENNETVYSNQVKTTDGKYSLAIPNLDALNYTAFAAFNGSDDYSNSSICKNFTVHKANPNLVI